MLSPDAQRLLELLPETGRIVNATAMALTGWDYDRMRAAKCELRDAGLVEMRASFGGPFGRTTNEPKATTTNKVLAAAENELYEPFRNWINEEFRPTDFVVGRDLFEVVVSANKRPNGSGKWEIPDLITVSIKKYRFVPELVFRTISFEVKPKGQAFNTYGIFEAISHSKFGNLTYYCFTDSTHKRNRIDRQEG